MEQFESYKFDYEKNKLRKAKKAIAIENSKKCPKCKTLLIKSIPSNCIFIEDTNNIDKMEWVENVYCIYCPKCEYAKIKIA